MNGNDVDKQETNMAVVQSKMIKQVATASLKCPIRHHHQIIQFVFEELTVLNTVTLPKFFEKHTMGYTTWVSF